MLLCAVLSVDLCIRLSVFPSHNRGVGRGAPSGNRPQHRGSWDGVVPKQPPRGGKHINARLREVAILANHGRDQNPNEQQIDDPLRADLDPHGDAALFGAGRR